MDLADDRALAEGPGGMVVPGDHFQHELDPGGCVNVGKIKPADDDFRAGD